MQTALKELQGDARVRIGFIAAFILLLFAIGLSTYNDNRLKQQTALVYRTYEVVFDLEHLLSKTKDAETGVRGFITTGNKSFFQPFVGSKKSVDSVFQKTLAETGDNASQTGKLRQLKVLVDKQFQLLDQLYMVTAIAQRNNVLIPYANDSMNVILDEGKATMDNIRLKVNEIQQAERQLLKERQDKVDSSFSNINTFTVVVLGVALILFVFGLLINLKENNIRKLASERIKKYQHELQQRITQLDAANERLLRMKSEEKFAATGRIARTIAHEIRNPLTNINLSVNQLQSDFLADNEEAEFLFKIIYRNSDRINHLITELLQSTKFAELNFTVIGVDELIDETLQEAKDRMALTEVKLTKLYNKPAPKIAVDVNKMKIALLNIVINALESMEKKQPANLVIETVMQDTKCEIKISDNGGGMNEETLGKIFEPYFTRKIKGGGLGLTNTQNIILNHQGEIKVVSVEGQGTTFSITLNAQLN
ncbi:MAG TPA: CHASE3 domain-containing protein [Chitinophagaceae bacterium]|nr:CHASE3 domain-containing protein [Chitinophagaceae bacterium]